MKKIIKSNVDTGRRTPDLTGPSDSVKYNSVKCDSIKCDSVKYDSVKYDSVKSKRV